MSNIFFCADHHLGHSNILTFDAANGRGKLRVFDSIQDHDEFIIFQHNKVVRSQDKVYFLGDVAMSHTHLHKLARMNGTKVLVKGNHDTGKLSQYMHYFKDVRAVHQFKGFIMSHIPIHPDSLGRWGVNIHGHLHGNIVRNPDSTPDTRYFNVSMEQLDEYTPISLEQIKSHYETTI